MSSSDESYLYSEEEEETQNDQNKIREDLKSMTFEEIMKLKENLGAKVYKEAVLGVDNTNQATVKKNYKDLKRLNKNRPRELSSKRQVPFMGTERKFKQKKVENITRDPRFDERAGKYDVKQFKKNYEFINDIREKEVNHLKRELCRVEDETERCNIKKTIQRLINKNVEYKKWDKQQQSLKAEEEEIKSAIAAGKQPHYMTKKERRTKQLVAQFEELKQSGKLSKHLEKRRKKNVSKDRKRIGFN